MNPSHHQVLLSDPAVGGKLLQHGHKVLDAAVPVAQQEDHHEERQDAEEEADHLQVGIGHLEENTWRHELPHCRTDKRFTLSQDQIQGRGPRDLTRKDEGV